MGIALNSLRNIVVRLGTVGFTLLLGVVIARTLGPEGRGAYALVTLFSGIGLALLGGIGNAAAYAISHQRRPVAEVVANVTSLALLAGVAALLATLGWYWLSGLVGAPAGWWLVIVGAALPALLTGHVLTWSFLGADDHGSYSFAIVAPSLLTLTLVWLTLALLPDSTRAALLAWLASQYAVLVWLYWRGRRQWRSLPLDRVSLASMRALIPFSATSGGANAVSSLNRNVDVLLVSRMLGVGPAGIYVTAVQLVEGLFLLSQAAGIAILARVGSASREEAAALVARGMRFSVALMLAGGAALAVAATWMVPLLFGGAFAGAVGPLYILTPGIVMWGMANLLATYYTNQLGRPRVPLTIAALSLMIAFALCLLLIPPFGLSGAAVATSVSYSAAILVQLEMFHRDSGIARRRLLLLDAADLRDARTTITAMIDAGRTRLPGRPPAAGSGEAAVFQRVVPAVAPSSGGRADPDSDATDGEV